jgi:hypothetical protein
MCYCSTTNILEANGEPRNAKIEDRSKIYNSSIPEDTMTLAADRVSRGKRVQAIQEELKEGNEPFAERLNRAASELGLDASWNPTRVSKVRSGLQDLSIEDATVLARVDPQQRGWTWVSYDVAVKKGEDAWAVLARSAKKSRSA